MKIKALKKYIPRTGYILFLLFFAIAILEVFRTKNWIAVGYWALIASLFLLLDSGKRITNYDQKVYKGS